MSLPACTLTTVSSTGEKVCTKCRRTQPATGEFFASARDTKDGLQGWCRQCHADYHRAHRRPEVVAKEKERDRLESEGQRRCATCAEVKPADATHYMPNMRQRLGLSTVCRQCMNVRARRNAADRWLRKTADPARTLQLRERKELAQRGLRRCSGCLKVLPATAEHFHKDKRGLHGLSTRCKDCQEAPRPCHRLNHTRHLLARYPGDAGGGRDADRGAGVRRRVSSVA